MNALDELALLGMAGDDGVGVTGALFECGLFEVEAEAGLAHLRIGPMATEAVAGEDGLDVLVEVEVLREPLRGLPGLLAVAAGDCGQERAGETQRRGPCGMRGFCAEGIGTAGHGLHDSGRKTEEAKEMQWVVSRMRRL